MRGRTLQGYTLDSEDATINLLPVLFLLFHTGHCDFNILSHYFLIMDLKAQNSPRSQWAPGPPRSGPGIWPEIRGAELRGAAHPTNHSGGDRP